MFTSPYLEFYRREYDELHRKFKSASARFLLAGDEEANSALLQEIASIADNIAAVTEKMLREMKIYEEAPG